MLNNEAQGLKVELLKKATAAAQKKDTNMSGAAQDESKGAGTDLQQRLNNLSEPLSTISGLEVTTHYLERLGVTSENLLLFDAEKELVTEAYPYLLEKLQNHEANIEYMRKSITVYELFSEVHTHSVNAFLKETSASAPGADMLMVCLSTLLSENPKLQDDEIQALTNQLKEGNNSSIFVEYKHIVSRERGQKRRRRDRCAPRGHEYSAPRKHKYNGMQIKIQYPLSLEDQTSYLKAIEALPKLITGFFPPEKGQRLEVHVERGDDYLRIELPVSVFIKRMLPIALAIGARPEIRYDKAAADRAGPVMINDTRFLMGC
jgi:hypothetical protein